MNLSMDLQELVQYVCSYDYVQDCLCVVGQYGAHRF